MKTITIIIIMFLAKVDYTVYNALPSQTDNTPTVTASLHEINSLLVANGQEKTLAVSPALKNRLGLEFEDEVLVCKCTEPIYNGWWIVRDLMNERYKNNIDFLVPNDVKLGKGSCVIQEIYNKK